MLKTEATANTVEGAIEEALAKLGISREEAEIEVLSQGGLFKKCKVAVSKKPSDGEKVQLFVETVLEKMGVEDFAVSQKEEDGILYVDVAGKDKGSIIGYRGEVLDSIQYLASLILNDGNGDFKRVVVDSEGYRAKREKTLQQLAKNLEQKVKRTGKPAKLEPMNPYERRIIHTALQNSKYVSTESDGVGNNRHVVISPKISGDILNAPSLSQRKTLNFVYRSDKKKRR